MNEVNRGRARILAGLIEDARVNAGRSAEDCAQALGITVDDYSKFEAAESDISLPSLEVLAMYHHVPMAYFWGSTALSDDRETDFELYQSLRQRIIGALIGQARIQVGRTVEELAVALDVTVERLTAYETGAETIPYFQLEMLSSDLGLPVQYFSDEQQGPLAKYEKQQQMQERFDELPPEIKAFVVEPINISYLETAVRLSKMDVNKLRSIAEGILDITL